MDFFFQIILLLLYMKNILIILLFNSTFLFSNSKIIEIETCFGKYEPMLLSTKPVIDTLIKFKETENPILWAGSFQGENNNEATFYVCFKNNFTKTLYIVDSLGMDFEFIELSSEDETGNEFWTEKVYLEILDSNIISINAENNLSLEIYERNNPYIPIIKEEIKYTREIYTALDSNKNYIAVFYNINNQIVNIQRIKN